MANLRTTIFSWLQRINRQSNAMAVSYDQNNMHKHLLAYHETNNQSSQWKGFLSLEGTTYQSKLQSFFVWTHNQSVQMVKTHSPPDPELPLFWKQAPPCRCRSKLYKLNGSNHNDTISVEYTEAHNIPLVHYCATGTSCPLHKTYFDWIPIRQN